MGSTPGEIGSLNISLDGLKKAYTETSLTNAEENNILRNSNINTVKLSYFRNSTFLNGTSVPGGGAISIGSVFKYRTFGTSSGGGKGGKPS